MQAHSLRAVRHDGCEREERALRLAEDLHFVMAYMFRKPDRDAGHLIELLSHSIRTSYPDARIVLLTNEFGTESVSDRRIELRVEETHSERVMVARMRAYRDYVRTVQPGRVIVFLDTDMLVMAPFDEILGPGVDLTVTVRPYRDMPINAGFIVARMDDPPKMVTFFERLHDCCASLSEEEQRWYGDQIALAKLLDAPSLRLKTAFIQRRGDLTVRFAPSLIYNRTPRPWMLRLLVYRPGTKILHFKGERKRSMARYAALYLSFLPRLSGLVHRR